MRTEIVILILCMATVTYIPRMLPLVVLSNKPIPDLLFKWLSFVPVAVLSALLAPCLFIQNQALYFSLQNKLLLTAVPTFIIAIKTRSMGLTILTGMLTSAALEFLIK